MAYFRDDSEYAYSAHFQNPGTINIGWLESGNAYEKSEPSDALLDLLWEFCSISVAQSRGFHRCDLCVPSTIWRSERHGKKLLLGTSEIRVFTETDVIFAAPTMIYHYVETHHYKPPEDFLAALSSGCGPTDIKYFERLKALNMEWRETSTWS